MSYIDDLNPFGFHIETIAIENIVEHPDNPRVISARDKYELSQSLSKFGLIDKPILNPTEDGKYLLIAGHQRLTILKEKGFIEVECQVPEKSMSVDECEELLIRHNKNTGKFDKDGLMKFDFAKLLDYGFMESELPKLEDELDKPVFNPKLPISPKMSEKHDYIMIIADNEIDLAYLEAFFDLQKEKDYKTSHVGLGRVLDFKRFKEVIDSKKWK